MSVDSEIKKRHDLRRELDLWKGRSLTFACVNFVLVACIFALISHGCTTGLFSPSGPQLTRSFTLRPEIPCYCLLKQTKPLHDADGVTADVILPFGNVVLKDQTIRAQGYDAWEVDRTRQTIGPITPEHIAKGKAARDAFQALIDSSDGLYASPSTERGVYGRLSADLYVRLKDGTMLAVSDWAEQNGHCIRPIPAPQIPVSAPSILKEKP